MTPPLGIGVIGTGNISMTYMRNAALFADLRLVACADLPGAPNARVATCVAGHLRRMGVEPAVLPGPEGDRVNIFASIGPRDGPGVILSGHMDVVPVEGQVWASDPVRLTERDGRLLGRGSSDMKGFLACMLAMVPEFQRAGLRDGNGCPCGSGSPLLAMMQS